MLQVFLWNHELFLTDGDRGYSFFNSLGICSSFLSSMASEEVFVEDGFVLKDSLNSRRVLPAALPSSGNLLGPNRRRATTKIKINPAGPILANITSSLSDHI